MSAAISMTTLFLTVSTAPLNNSGVYSNVTLFIPSWTNLNGAPKDVICFVGKADGLDINVQSFYEGGGEQCQDRNGCGVHVQAGMDCTSFETELGHWYNKETLSSDPWIAARYATTNGIGYGEFANCISTGFDLTSDPSPLFGRAFIIHAEDGNRTSCGLIEPKDDLKMTLSIAELTMIQGSTPPMDIQGITGLVSVLSGLAGDVGVNGVCYQGYALTLEPDVESFLLGTGSMQCNVSNGCGAHIHAGAGCATRDEQGGHYYDGEELKVDPWLLQSYYTTDSTGAGAFVGCVLTGTNATDFENRPFIVHGMYGNRLACGIVDNSSGVDTDPEWLQIFTALLPAVVVGSLLIVN